jgi:hypothetical protein
MRSQRTGHGRSPAPRREIGPCIAPDGLLWLRQDPEKDSRRILGIEKCALQDICMRPDVVSSTSNHFKNKLAGNGFCAPVTLVISIVLFVVAAKHAKLDFDAEQAKILLDEACALDQGWPPNM